MNLRSFIVAVLALFLTLQSEAQTNFALHTFGAGRFFGGVNGYYTNSDGINPNGWLTPSGGTMYGTTVNGGSKGSGTIFSINTNGAFNFLFAFPTNNSGTGNSKGANPNGGMVLSNGVLYGTTYAGGLDDQGTIFSFGTNSTSVTNLYSFSDASSGSNSDGANPSAGLVAAGVNLYGTASAGGAGGNGVIYKYNINTKNFAVLYTFTAGNTNLFGVLTNSDGANPNGRLLFSNFKLYGTTSAGGTNGLGTVFVVSTNGSAFAVLHHFDANGASPNSDLVLSGGTLFGIGGSQIFSINTNGTGFTVLKQFDDYVDGSSYANSGLTISNNTLFCAASTVGDNGFGQIFSLTTNGANYADFYDFTPPIQIYPNPPTNSNGIYPNGGMTFINGYLFGAASEGGPNNSGILFKAGAPPSPLASQISGTNLLLSFPAIVGINYTIQQNTNVASTNWITLTNFLGNGSVTQLTLPRTNKIPTFFRVR